MAALEVGAIDQKPRKPDERISAKVILCGRSMPHDSADRVAREAARLCLNLTELATLAGLYALLEYVEEGTYPVFEEGDLGGVIASARACLARHLG